MGSRLMREGGGPQTKIADLVQITPQDFRKASIDALNDNINAKYANKVSTRPWALGHSLRPVALTGHGPR